MAKARAQAATPGVVLFAAVVLFVIGGLHAVQAIAEFADNTWTFDAANGLLVENNLWIWGVIDVVLAVLLIFGGASLLAGQPFGRWVAIIWAIFAAIRWLYWIPAAPVFSVIALVIAMMVLYAATVYPEHFSKK